MECSQTTWLTNEEYLKQFYQDAVRLRIPLSGSLCLTHRCNLRCIHCYLGSKSEVNSNELNTNQFLSIVDEISKAGCLNLLITGGEPLLREDFSEIYRHAKKNGLLVTIFSNGTLISDKIIELFDDFPPRAIEITLYGATAVTHDAITQINESFERSISGIRQLLNHKLNVKLKTILMVQNKHEFFDIENIAKEFGVKFRFDAGIFPCLSGDKTPIRLRVSPQEAVEMEFADDKRRRQWQDYYKKNKDIPVVDNLYICGAGLTNFHIDPFGNVQPCIMTNKYKYCLLDSDFLTRWQNDIARFRKKKVDNGYACNKCKKRTLCGFCPAFFELENGSEYIHSEYLCTMGQHRFKAIANNSMKGV